MSLLGNIGTDAMQRSKRRPRTKMGHWLIDALADKRLRKVDPNSRETPTWLPLWAWLLLYRARRLKRETRTIVPEVSAKTPITWWEAFCPTYGRTAKYGLTKEAKRVLRKQVNPRMSGGNSPQRWNSADFSEVTP